MLFLFFTIGWIAVIDGAVCGTIGYVWKEGRWVDSVGDYFCNLARMAFQAACGAAIIWVYVAVFGWPEPD